MPSTERFDKAYYDRFYRNPTTRAASHRDAALQAGFIVAYLRYLRLQVRHVVDIGCGLGRLLDALGDAIPSATRLGIESSRYLCDRYGWEPGALPHDVPRRSFDLVVCDDVLGYLDAEDAAAAIATLARLTRKALFFGVLTEEDLAICDPSRTDTDVHLRPAAWYRRRLGQRFQPVGGGLWLRKPVTAPIWTLERP